MLNIPLVLTLTRLILSILFFPFVLFFFWSETCLFNNLLLGGIFGLLSLTDFLDGFIARALSQETNLGKALDPIADKFLVSSTFITLLALNKIAFYWVIIFVAREFFVMGLRLIALESKLDIRVSFLAKLKTTLQMLFLAFVICHTQTINSSSGIIFFIEQGSLIIIAFLAVFTAYDYFKKFYRFCCK